MVCLPIRGSPFRRGRGNTPFICRLFVLLLTGALFLFGSKAYADDQDGDASSTPSGESQASESTGNPGPPPKGAKEILRKEDAGGKMLASTVNPALRESFFSILLEEDVRRRPAGALDLFSDTPLVPQQYSLYRVRPRGNESSLLQYYEAYIMFQRDVFRLMTSEDLSALESLRARGRENFHNFYEQNIRRVRAESSEVNQLLRDVQGLENLRLSLGSEYAEGIAEGGALSAIEMAQLKASLESQALGRLSSDRRGNPDLALMLRDSVGRRLIQMEDSGGNTGPAESREKLSFAELQQRLASSIERVRSEHRLQRILATIPWIEQINREAKAEFESRGEVFSEISDGYVLMSDLAGKKTGSQSQRAYHPINQSLVSEFSIDDEGRLLVTDDTTGLITEVIGIENDLQMSSDKGVFAFQVEDYFRIRELRDTDFGWEVKPQEERGQLLLENFVYSEILAEMERLKEKIEKSQNLSEIRIAFNEFNQQVELMMSGESVGDSNDDITRKLQKKLMMALYPRASQQEGVLKDAEHYFSITSERYRHIDPWIEELRWARLGDTFTSGSWLHRDQQSRAVNNHSLSNVVDRYERWAQKRARQKNWRQEVVHKIANHPVRFAVWSAGITAALMFGGGAIHGHLSSASNRPPPLMGGVEEAAQNGLREEAKEKSLKFKTYNIPGATMLEIASLEELNQARNLSERLSGENGNFRVFGQEVFPVLGERMAIPMPPFMHLESLHLMNSDGLLYKQGIDYNVIYHEDKGLYGIHFLKPVSEVKISYTYNESLEANFDRSSQFRQVTENLNSERMKIVSNMMREAELTAIADDLEARMSRGSISLNDLRNSIKLNSGYSNALAPADILMSDHQLQNNPFLVFRPLIHEGRAFCECDPSNLINYLAKKLYYGEDADVSVNMRGAFVVDGSEVRESHAYSEASLRSTGETHSFDSTAGGPVSEEEKQILEARDADARFWLRADISLERIDELAIRHLENGLGVKMPYEAEQVPRHPADRPPRVPPVHRRREEVHAAPPFEDVNDGRFLVTDENSAPNAEAGISEDVEPDSRSNGEKEAQVEEIDVRETHADRELSWKEIHREALENLWNRMGAHVEGRQLEEETAQQREARRNRRRRILKQMTPEIQEIARITHNLLVYVNDPSISLSDLAKRIYPRLSDSDLKALTPNELLTKIYEDLSEAQNKVGAEAKFEQLLNGEAGRRLPTDQSYLPTPDPRTFEEVYARRRRAWMTGFANSGHTEHFDPRFVQFFREELTDVLHSFLFDAENRPVASTLSEVSSHEMIVETRSSYLSGGSVYCKGRRQGIE